jgi:hypothetical protein
MRPILLILATVLAVPARAQLFVDDTVSIPQGVNSAECSTLNDRA